LFHETGFTAKHIKYKKGEKRPVQTDMDRVGGEAPTQPILDLKNVISVLISSDFLQMAELVNECMSYVILNMADVVRLPIDMSCLNDSLIWKIATKTPLDFLYNLHDKRDKLTSRLLRIKFYQFVQLKIQRPRSNSLQADLNKFIEQEAIHTSMQEALRTDTEIDVFSTAYKSANFEVFERELTKTEQMLMKKMKANALEVTDEVCDFIKYCSACKRLFISSL